MDATFQHHVWKRWHETILVLQAIFDRQEVYESCGSMPLSSFIYVDTGPTEQIPAARRLETPLVRLHARAAIAEGALVCPQRPTPLQGGPAHPQQALVPQLHLILIGASVDQGDVL